MICYKCGTKITENEKFCSNCGKKIEDSSVNTDTKQESKKIKFKVSDVVNKENVLKSTNRVAYIANGWAVQVRKRGENLAIIISIIYFLIACANIPYDGDGTGFFFSTFGTGLLYAIIVVITFNTTAFIIRMGAEVIQLLDDIKNKE